MTQIPALTSAIQAYFDLMYDAVDDNYPSVFHDEAIIHGMRDGKLTVWSAQKFRDVIKGRPSPKSMQSPRDEAIIRIDCTSEDMATAKVRVRIGQTCFIDELTFHRFPDRFKVTSKAYHIAQVFPEGS
jgi:hypothetical protein